MKKPQLFLLHFAGGGRYSYNFMIPFLDKFYVAPLELPGRNKRISEALIRDFDLAVEDYYNQIVRLLDSSPFIIYGHSMGALLGFQVAKMLETSFNRPPCYLVFTGNAGPNISDEKTRYLLDRKNFIDELEKLGGLPKEISQNEELMDFFEAILRADFEIVEKHKLFNNERINTPLYVLMGSEEEKVQNIQNWSNFTTSTFEYEVVSGGHFFIYNNASKIAGVIKKCYDSICV